MANRRRRNGYDGNPLGDIGWILIFGVAAIVAIIVQILKVLVVIGLIALAIYIVVISLYCSVLYFRNMRIDKKVKKYDEYYKQIDTVMDNEVEYIPCERLATARMDRRIAYLDRMAKVVKEKEQVMN